MLRAALKGRSYNESASSPRDRSFARSESNTSRLSSTPTTSRPTLYPTTPADMPSLLPTNSESRSSSSSLSSFATDGTSQSSCLNSRATLDGQATSKFTFHRSAINYNQMNDDADDTPLVCSFCHLPNRLQGHNNHYCNSSSKMGFGASAACSSTCIVCPVDSIPTLTSLRERGFVYSHQKASQSDSHLDRMELKRRLYFRANASEASIADHCSYDGKRSTGPDCVKRASSPEIKAKTGDPVKGLHRLSSLFSRKNKRIAGSPPSPSVRNGVTWMSSWSMALSSPRAKLYASERQCSASSGSSPKQSFSALSLSSSVSCGTNDRGHNSSSSTPQLSNSTNGPAVGPRFRYPVRNSQSTATILLRAATPATRTAHSKPACTFYNRNLRGPCIYHKNLKNAQRLSKRRSRHTLNKQCGKEGSNDRSKGRKRISHRLAVFSTAIETAAKRLSLDSGLKRTSVLAANRVALAQEVASLVSEPRHQQNEVGHPASEPTFFAQKVADHHSPTQSMKACAASVSLREHSSSSDPFDSQHTKCKSEEEQHHLLQVQQQDGHFYRQLGPQPPPASSACVAMHSLSQIVTPSHGVHGRMRRPASPSPSASSILDSHASARVSTVNVCAEIISPRLRIRARSVTMSGVTEQETKSSAYSRKRRSTIATPIVTTTPIAALAITEARKPTEASTNCSSPYGKEKLDFFEPFRSQAQGSAYVSFHHDLSHLESSPLLENMDDNGADYSSAEAEREETLPTAPGSPKVPCQCSKPTRSRQTPPSLPSMSLPNLAGSAVNLMITLPPSHKRRPPPPPPPHPRPPSRREDEEPFLTLQEHLWQREITLTATPLKAVALNSHHSRDAWRGLIGMTSMVSLPTAQSASSSASSSLVSTSSSAAAFMSGSSKVTKKPDSQKRWGWLSWMGA